MATLDSLSPEYRTQYESSLPEIKRAARAASQARGMFYSGDAIDSETKAEEDLLAKLSAQSAGAQVTQSENAKNRELEQKLADQQTAAAKRAQTLGMIGTGMGSLGTIAGLHYLHPGGGANVMYQDGIAYEKGADGKWVPALGGSTPVGGAGMAAGSSGGAAGGLGPQSVDYPQFGSPAAGSNGLASLTPDAGTGPGGYGPATYNNVAEAGHSGIAASAPAAIASHPPTSMWQLAGAAGLGAGGGLIGNMLSNQVNGGKGSTASSVGAGVGGLLGGLAGYGSGYYGAPSNPYLSAGLAGLGALGGSFGGGLIGNLFK